MPEPFVITIPKAKPRRLPVVYNPARRLFAAIVLQAVSDLVRDKVGDQDRHTARRFLASEAGYIADEFDLPLQRIQALVGANHAT